MSKIDFSQAYIKKRIETAKLLRGRKLTYSEIKKRLNLSHTETGRIVKDLLSNNEIKKEGDVYSLSKDLPYWPMLTSSKIVHQAIKTHISKEKSICVIDPMTIYGLDKTNISKETLKQIEKELKKIYPRKLNIKDLIQKDRQEKYTEIFNKKIEITKDKQIKSLILKNKKDIFDFICKLDKNKKDLKTIKKMFEKRVNNRKFSQDSFFEKLEELHKEWCKIGGNPFNIKVINNL